MPTTSPGPPPQPPPSERRSPLVRHTFDIPSSAAGMTAVHEALDRVWLSVSEPRSETDMPWDGEFATAVAEIAANIIRHAHIDAPVETTPTISVRLTLWRTRIEAHFVDRGAPYTPPIASTVAGMPALGEPIDIDALVEGGRGLALARAALDRLAYRRSQGGENHWWLVKRRPANGPRDDGD